MSTTDERPVAEEVAETDSEFVVYEFADDTNVEFSDLEQKKPVARPKGNVLHLGGSSVGVDYRLTDVDRANLALELMPAFEKLRQKWTVTQED